jgi:hypothetical protein
MGRIFKEIERIWLCISYMICPPLCSKTIENRRADVIAKSGSLFLSKTTRFPVHL